MSTYVDDNLNGTSGTLLSAHTPDIAGSTWAIMSSQTGTNVLTGDGHLRSNKTGSNSCTTYSTGVLAVADTETTVEINAKTILAADVISFFLRAVDASNGYLIQLTQAGVLTLNRFVAGVPTSLCSQTMTVSAGTTHSIKLIHVGTQLAMYWDGALVTAASGANPVTDSTFTAAGKFAVRIGASTSTAQTDSTGIQISRILVADAIPVNTVAPVVSGTRVAGYTLSCTQGTWSGVPTSYAYQWLRDGVAISGATSSTYLLDVADVGKSVACAVTASNANGAGVAANSNSLLIVAVMVAGDVQWLAGGADNLGGAPGAAITDPRTVFDDVLASEAAPGDTEYRLIYIKNAHTVQQLSGAVAWIQSNTSSPDTTLAIGVATEAVNANVGAIANEQTAPAGVTFGAPTNNGTGFALGDLPVAAFKGLWLRRTVSANAAATGTDAATIGWQGSPT